jgi:hypothetical protein
MGGESDICLPPAEFFEKDKNWKMKGNIQNINAKQLFYCTVKPLFIVFVGGLKKKRWIRENNRFGSHSLNRIHSGTTEIERWIRENELSGKTSYPGTIDRGFTVF